MIPADNKKAKHEFSKQQLEDIAFGEFEEDAYVHSENEMVLARRISQFKKFYPNYNKIELPSINFTN